MRPALENSNGHKSSSASHFTRYPWSNCQIDRDVEIYQDSFWISTVFGICDYDVPRRYILMENIGVLEE